MKRQRLWMKPFHKTNALILCDIMMMQTHRIRQGHIWMLQTTKELMLAVDVTAVWLAISFGSSVFWVMNKVRNRRCSNRIPLHIWSATAGSSV